MRFKIHSSILKGLISFSPGLARFFDGLPWVIAIIFHNPEGGCYLIQNGVIVKTGHFRKFLTFSFQIKIQLLRHQLVQQMTFFGFSQQSVCTQ